MRALLFAALASALGCSLAAQWSRRWLPAGPWRRRLQQWVRAALLVALAAQGALLLGHGQSLPAAPGWAAALQAAGKTWVGQVFYAQGGLILLALLLSLRPAAGRGLVLLLLAGVAAVALSGHAVASGESPLLSAAALLHAALAGLWFGALGPLWAARRAVQAGALAAPWADLLRIFSRLALPAMLGIVASGAVLAWWSVGRWPALFATPYGRLLLLKLALVAAVLWLAWCLRRWLVKATPRGADDGAGAAGRWLAAEQLVACCVVGTAGVLASLVPAAHDRIQWPFGFRLAPQAAWMMRSEQVRWPLAAAALLLASGMVTTAVAWRRRRRVAVLAGLGSLAASAALALPAVAVDAYPTTYSASPVAYEVSSVVDGARLYQQHCTACHGSHGRGDGPLAARLQPPPANLTEPHLGWHTHGDMYWWLTHGFPGSAMPGFAATTTDVERWHLINYLTALSLGHQARNLGDRPAPRDPWLAAIDFRFAMGDGSYGVLSELRGNQAALLVFVNDRAELQRLRALAAQAPRLAPQARVLAVVPPRLAAQAAAARGPLDIVVDDDGAIAEAWALYRRTLPAPDFRDEQPLPSRIEFLIDRFGFVRARWRSDEAPEAPAADQLAAALAALAREPELKSADVHAH